MNIDKKVAIITGGASGMGAATAIQLAKQGAQVALLDMNLEGAQSLAEELGGMAVSCDVSDADSAENALQAVVKQYGEVHLAVNCAGIAPAKRVVAKDGSAMPLDNFKRVIDINLIGTFNIVRLVSAQMSQQQPQTDSGERGVIINTASVAAFEGQIGQAAYSASKGGIVAMALPIARELERFGIRVMTIAPGIMSTPMMAGMPENVQQALAQTVTFPKRLGEASEYASLVQHIVENEYLNGEVIRLDGAIRMSAR
ncbi:MAG: SDR family NAD(P)-dependent oxidoreductase [Coxiellaceae bacterium]|nr:SDR family NAD(P)-dependent oxidoreductase [Coxiellaceae bacterium]